MSLPLKSEAIILTAGEHQNKLCKIHAVNGTIYTVQFHARRELGETHDTTSYDFEEAELEATVSIS